MLHPPINSVIFILYETYCMPRGDTNIFRTIKKKAFAMLPHRFEIVPLEKDQYFWNRNVFDILLQID